MMKNGWMNAKPFALQGRRHSFFLPLFFLQLLFFLQCSFFCQQNLNNLVHFLNKLRDYRSFSEQRCSFSEQPLAFSCQISTMLICQTSLPDAERRFFSAWIRPAL